MKNELDKLVADSGIESLPEVHLVQVHLKNSVILEGHISSKSYIVDNALILYTNCKLENFSYIIPPPNVDYIENMRKVGDWGVKLINYTKLVACVQSVRRALAKVSFLNDLQTVKKMVMWKA